jgi:hypothetical protein
MSDRVSTGAGPPHHTLPTVRAVFRLPRRLAGDDALLLLKVHGTSMTDAALIDGDWAVVRQQPVANSGEIVAAVIGQEVTIKRFKRISKQIWLIPENPAHIPIPGSEATILGKVIAILRLTLSALSRRTAMSATAVPESLRLLAHGLSQVPPSRRDVRCVRSSKPRKGSLSAARSISSVQSSGALPVRLSSRLTAAPRAPTTEVDYSGALPRS